jgi:hypothetical protein
MSRNLTPVDPPSAGRAAAPSPNRGLTVEHLLALLMVFGFTGWLIVSGYQPHIALALALGGLAGTMLITTTGVAHTLRRRAARALADESAERA